MPFPPFRAARLPAAAAALLAALATGAPAQTALLSVSTTGQAGDDRCSTAVSTFDGRFVAFASRASNLVPGDTNGGSDVFVRDLGTWSLERVSLSSSGAQANGWSDSPDLSADARWVVFGSTATNLVPGDLNAGGDIFLRDRLTGVTQLVSRALGGGTGNAWSVVPSLSGDGRYVVFESDATDLVPGDTNGLRDIFRLDAATGVLSRVSVANGGGQSNGSSSWSRISYDGRLVVFSSTASNLVPNDTNGAQDIFVRDLVLGTTIRVSIGGAGTQADARSDFPRFSDDSRFVVYVSEATNLVAGDANGHSDVFLRDLTLGTTRLVSRSQSGGGANGASIFADVSWDGRFVSFTSLASNLVGGDTNGTWDVFVNDAILGTTERVSLTSTGAQAPLGSASFCTLSPNGRFAFFTSKSTLAPPSGPVGVDQMYLHDRGYVCITPQVYCTAKVNSLGCTPAIGVFGCSSASNPNGFFVLGWNVRNQKSGLLFYGTSGKAAIPFQGGTLCVKPPVRRTPATGAGGNPSPANDCSGLFVLDMNSFARGTAGGSPLPALSSPGQIVQCQWWGRDQGFPAPQNSTLTNGLEYLVGL